MQDKEVNQHWILQLRYSALKGFNREDVFELKCYAVSMQ